MLQTAIEAARRAGRVIAERYPTERTVTVKGYRDLVTDADIAAEEVIIDLIQARFPDHTIVSEEAGGSKISSDYTWMVDPLDGTTNYVHDFPFFCVSVAVVHQRERKGENKTPSRATRECANPSSSPFQQKMVLTER